MTTKRAGGKSKAGRKPSLNAEHVKVLRAITREQPHCSLGEITRELHRRTGAVACTATVRKALRAAGITRLKPVRAAAVRAPIQGGRPERYGYTSMHRREDGDSGMNTDLTDAEWALVADLFERDGGRGMPERYALRRMVNACCYLLRTGCAWRFAP
jgi:putative transposase